MKIIIIITLLNFLGFHFAEAQLSDVDLSQEVQAVLNVKNSQDKEKINQALRKLDNQVIYSWSRRATFTEDQLRQSIQTQLEPIQEQLIRYAKTEDHGLRGRSASLLGYSKLSPEAIEALYKIVLNTRFDKKQSDAVATAIDSIYSSSNVNKDVEQALLKRLSEGITNQYVGYRLWASHVGFWKITNGIPILIEGLKNNELNLISSAEALKLMGGKAKDALPELRNQLEKARIRNAERKVIEALTFAIQVIEKDILEKEGASGLSAITNQTTSNISDTTNLFQTNIVTPKTETLPATENSNWLRWVWVVGVIIVGWLVFKLFGKRKEK